MSNEEKSRALGMNFGTASNRLRKTILFSLLQRFGVDHCFQCSGRIETVDDLSIEHKEPWQSAPDPKAAFFDLDNTAFSHLRCNVGEPRRAKTHCPSGHRYTPENTYRWPGGNRRCRECFRTMDRQRWHRKGRADERRRRRNSE